MSGFSPEQMAALEALFSTRLEQAAQALRPPTGGDADRDSVHLLELDPSCQRGLRAPVGLCRGLERADTTRSLRIPQSVGAGDGTARVGGRSCAATISPCVFSMRHGASAGDNVRLAKL